MSAFTKLCAEFCSNWTTILVGWTGLGVYSPWPDRWTEFPPLLSVDDIIIYAEKRLAASASVEDVDATVQILSPEWKLKTREEVERFLKMLSIKDASDPSTELRKWRVVILEQTLQGASSDSLYAWMGLAEFWQSFGFPRDAPPCFQKLGDVLASGKRLSVSELEQLRSEHLAWIGREKTDIKRRQCEDLWPE